MWFHVVSYLYFHRNDLGIASDCSDFDGGGGGGMNRLDPPSFQFFL